MKPAHWLACLVLIVVSIGVGYTIGSVPVEVTQSSRADSQQTPRELAEIREILTDVRELLRDAVSSRPGAGFSGESARQPHSAAAQQPETGRDPTDAAEVDTRADRVQAARDRLVLGEVERIKLALLRLRLRLQNTDPNSVIPAQAEINKKRLARIEYALRESERIDSPEHLVRFEAEFSDVIP